MTMTAADTHYCENLEVLNTLVVSMISMFNLSATSAVEKEDLVQEGLLTLWEKRERYDPDKGDYLRWASTILYNRFMDIVRHDVYKKKTETRFSDLKDRIDRLHCSVGIPQTSAEVAEDLYNALAEAFRNEKSRTVRIGLVGIWNAYSGRYTLEELAKHFNVSQIMLNSCISRARKRLRPYLSDYFK